MEEAFLKIITGILLILGSALIYRSLIEIEEKENGSKDRVQRKFLSNDKEDK